MNRDDRQAAQNWARSVMSNPNTVILDTETTGLDSSAEIVEIAAINTAGVTLFNSLVRPTKPIPLAASRIHGITDDRIEMECAPTWLFIEPKLVQVLLGSMLIIYNADYDMRLIYQTYRAAGVALDPPPLVVAPHAIDCAMRWYSQYVGEWNEFYGNYRWQRLPEGDHSALGDCRATLAVLKRMAGV